MTYKYDQVDHLDRLVDFRGAREYHVNKDRAKRDKRMPLKEAIAEFVQDGDILGETGFSYVRSPIQAYFEIVRQQKKHIKGIGSPMSNVSYMIARDCMDGVHLSYVGVEMRGNDKHFSRAIINKKAEIHSLWSHGAMALGFKAAQLGVPCVGSKQLLGTDLVKYNPYVKVIDNPVGKDKDPVCMIPALFPDVCIIHCQQADRYGNAVIQGPAINDIALASACRKVIITAERIVPEMTIRDSSSAAIPFWYVDAVVELPYGAYPGACPGYYFWHRQWWEFLIRIGTVTDENVMSFTQEWIMDCKDQYEWIEKAGGIRTIEHDRKLMEAAQLTADDSLADYDYQEVIPKWD